MTDAEIRAAEKMAKEWLARSVNTQSRMVDTARVGCVPGLCETILALCKELKRRRGIAP